MPNNLNNLHRKNKAIKEVLIYITLLFVLILTSVNISTYFKPKVLNVLGVETQNDDVYWKNFLTKNPNYLPGLVEIGDYEKVTKIDPNYLLPSSFEASASSAGD